MCKNTNSFFEKFIGFTFTVILLVGCASSQTITPTLSSPATKTDLPPTTTTPNQSTPTPFETPTFTPQPDFSNPSFQPQDISGLQNFVMYNLDQAKNISDIKAYFDNQNARKAWFEGYEIDFDGNGRKELFLDGSMVNENNNFENVYWIAKESGGKYQIEYSMTETAYYGAKIEFIDDLNQDKLPDLIFSRPLLAGGSGADIFIARLENGEYVIHHIAVSEQVIDKMYAGNQDTSGNKQLIITGFQSGWESSGPGRTVEEIYSAKGNEYELTDSHFLPSKYRIHVLQDAQIAFDAGNDKLAVKLWEQAAHDPKLENFSSMWIKDDKPEKYQPAYAVYRLYTYFTMAGDEINAQKYFRELSNKYPQGSPGGEFIKLAQEAKRLLNISHNPDIVCNGIYDFMNATDEYANFLIDHWYWGDYNLDIVEFCPVKEK